MVKIYSAFSERPVGDADFKIVNIGNGQVKIHYGRNFGWEIINEKSLAEHLLPWIAKEINNLSKRIVVLSKVQHQIIRDMKL